MSINRIHRKRNNYSTILNEGAHDRNLSWQAKGLLWYLCTKPDGWEVMEGDLANQTDAGVKAVRSILKQLETAGYLVRWCERGDRGHLRWRSEIFESKADAQDWIGENIEQLKNAVRVAPGTIKAASSIYPLEADGEALSMHPLTVDGETVDAATVDAQPAHLINTELSNNGIKQLLKRENRSASANERIEPKQPSLSLEPELEPKQVQTRTADRDIPSSPVPVQTRVLHESEAIGSEQRSSAVPPPRDFFAERVAAKRCPYPSLVAEGLGHLWVGPGRNDFQPSLIVAAQAYLGKYKLPAEEGDARSLIHNKIYKGHWAALEQLESEAKSLSDRGITKLRSVDGGKLSVVDPAAEAAIAERQRLIEEDIAAARAALVGRLA